MLAQNGVCLERSNFQNPGHNYKGPIRAKEVLAWLPRFPAATLNGWFRADVST